ncbi:hypothetical protein ROZALSC1DRAFT_31868 [Rozella allomycis CSF55]|uniref:Uncharacterized protein n=1 Tax=Rozella allomycis (strain CSF55) TaxID=988480 RepID=A0A075B2H6_ROZAC|nr:hypothetical protein O9G_006382 [Rozella allomycis CSF55]RKP15995.1 hypothetical protein ROZALSC1DRAFT_31868 [Rozella allomycis CSF55]|eukprot:EPZ36752.1 hypothetical protein O9G_006382 [Rozella allomycis CSF55]
MLLSLEMPILNKVKATRDEIRDRMDIANEISETIAQPLGNVLQVIENGKGYYQYNSAISTLNSNFETMVLI